MLAALVIAALSLANVQTIKISYLFGYVKLPLILLILISVLLGFALALLISFPKDMRTKKALTLANKKIQELEQAIKQSEEQQNTATSSDTTARSSS